MSENSHIDKIFREGIREINFSSADAAWEKLEAEMDAAAGNNRRRYGFLLLFALLSIGVGGLVFLKMRTADTATLLASAQDKNNAVPNTVNATTPGENRQPAISSNQSTLFTTGKDAKLDNTVQLATGQHTNGGVLSKRFSAQQPLLQSKGAGSVLINNAAIAEEMMHDAVESESAAGLAGEKIQQQQLPAPMVSMATPIAISKEVYRPVLRTRALEAASVASLKQDRALSRRKFAIELIGGTDAMRMNRKAGYYAGVRVSRLLDKGTAISAGLSYTNNTVKDNYRRATKPAEQKQYDFKLLDMTMLRMPIYIHQQMAKSKFSLMAGLVPSYVVDANIYILPNSLNGNQETRHFSIDDVNRFNILFGAGIKYAVLPRVAVEVSGSYGFTGLVKDSYKNQSRIIDNFKSIQAGLVLKLN